MYVQGWKYTCTHTCIDLIDLILRGTEMKNYVKNSTKIKGHLFDTLEYLFSRVYIKWRSFSGKQ